MNNHLNHKNKRASNSKIQISVSDIFPINQQAGKLRIALGISIFIAFWLFLALIVFVNDPISKKWLIQFFGPPNSLLNDIFYDFLAKIFSFPVILFLILSILLYQSSLFLASSFFAKLLDFSDHDSIKNHLTRCLFSVPRYPRIFLEDNFFESQDSDQLINIIGGPAFLASSENGILFIKKGWKNTVTSIELFSDTGELFLEVGSRLIEFLHFQNTSKFENITGQSKDGMEIRFCGVEIKYHFNTSDLNSMSTKLNQIIFDCVYYQDINSKGFKAFLRNLFNIFSTSFIRTNPSLIYEKIVDQTNDERLHQKKHDLKKIITLNHKMLYHHSSILTLWKHSKFRRNRNRGLYPLLRKVTDVPTNSTVYPDSLEDLILQMGGYIENSLDNFFGRKIIVIDNLQISEIKNVNV